MTLSSGLVLDIPALNLIYRERLLLFGRQADWNVIKENTWDYELLYAFQHFICDVVTTLSWSLIGSKTIQKRIKFKEVFVQNVIIIVAHDYCTVSRILLEFQIEFIVLQQSISKVQPVWRG